MSRNMNSIWAIGHGMTKRRKYSDSKARLALILAYCNRCQYCKKACSEEHLTLDHIDSPGKGGKHELANYSLACFPCNASKGCYTLENPVRSRIIAKAKRKRSRIMNLIIQMGRNGKLENRFKDRPLANLTAMSLYPSICSDDGW